MAKVLLCAVDGGAYGALSPVATLLTQTGHQSIWVAEENSIASQRLSANAYRVEDSNTAVDAILSRLDPDVVIAGVSSDGEDLAFRLSVEAMRRSIPVVKVSDFYGTGMPHERNFRVTRSCVLDEASRLREAQMRQMPLQHVVATGGPQFDALMKVEELPYGVLHPHTPSVPFILCIGPSTHQRVLEILLLVKECLPVLPERFGFGLLLHPKSNTASFEGEFKDMLRGSGQVRYVDDSELRGLGSNDALLASADLILGATSTELIKACYLRKSVLSIVPYGGSNFDVLNERGIKEMPTSKCGATLHIGSAGDLCHALYCFLLQEKQAEWERIAHSMRTAQKEHYSLDGHNALRVARVAESVL